MTIPSARLSPVWMPQYMRASKAHSSRRNRTVEFSVIQAVIEVCDRECRLPANCHYGRMCSLLNGIDPRNSEG